MFGREFKIAVKAITSEYGVKPRTYEWVFFKTLYWEWEAGEKVYYRDK